MLAVDGEAGHGGDLGAGGDDGVLELDAYAAPARLVDDGGVGPCELSGALDVFTLIAFDQDADVLDELGSEMEAEKKAFQKSQSASA